MWIQEEHLSAADDKAWQTHTELPPHQPINRLETSAERITFRSGIHSHPSSHQYPSPCQSSVPVAATERNPSSAELSWGCKPYQHSAHPDLRRVATGMALLPQPQVSYLCTIKQGSAADTETLRTCPTSQKTFLASSFPWKYNSLESTSCWGFL